MDRLTRADFEQKWGNAEGWKNGQRTNYCSDEMRRDLDTLLAAERERVNVVWIAVLHDEGIVDMKDADGSNKTVLLKEVKERLLP